MKKLLSFLGIINILVTTVDLKKQSQCIGCDLISITCYNPTLQTVSRIQPLNDNNLETKLDLKQKIGFLILGWNTNKSKEWVVNLNQAWIENRNDNLCLVDWSYYGTLNYIVTALYNVRTVSNYLIDFVKLLNKQYHVPLKNLIFVGHSLGAHISGNIGEHYKGKIGMIIGLDPAGPLFSIPFLVSTKDRLDKTDALLVQAVHTSDYGYGINIKSGHQDFYPNTGLIPQKGCLYPNLVDAVFDDPVRCAHHRSVQYFADSLRNPKMCLGVKCANLEKFLNKNCTNVYDVMGLDTKGIPGSFYFRTDEAPVCTGDLFMS